YLWSDIIREANPLVSLLIRRLDQRVKDAIKARAAAHGRSMEAEARAILEAGALAKSSEAKPSARSAWDVVRASLTETGGFDLAEVRDRRPYEPRVRFEDDGDPA